MTSSDPNGAEASGQPVEPPRLHEVVAALDGLYPPSSAQAWDAVGLVCGDVDRPVTKVLLAVDPTAAVVEEAVEWGADLLVAHHPLLLRPVSSVATTSAKGRVLTRLVKRDCALYVAHTNADVAVPGVSDALARVLGLDDLEPLVPMPVTDLDKVVTFVPTDAAESLVDALAAAGAGELGPYTRCAWTATGTGTFTPGPGSAPAVGTVGEAARVDETRVEMVLPRHRRRAVVRALRAAHPYEEPAFDVLELADEGHGTGLGRVGTLAEAVTLEQFARLVATALPFTVQGVRVSGDKDAMVQRIAVSGGAGDDQFAAVRASGADVYVTADLRHHPASEARETAADGTPYLVDVSHWASEWPWLAGCESRLVAALGEAGTTVETRVSTTRTDPWTMHVPSRGSPS